MTDNVIDIIPYAEAEKAVPLQVKAEVYQRVIREWSAYITANQFIILMAIVDRTIGWGFREAYFTHRALVQGDSYYASLPLKRTAAFDALAGLEAMGLVRRRHDRDVPDRVHYSVNINWKPSAADLPKHLQSAKTQSATRTDPSVIRTDPSATRTLYTVLPSTVLHNDNQELRHSPRSLANPAEIIREKAAASQTANRARSAERKLFGGQNDHQATSTHIERAWRVAIIETFPGNVVPVWTAREKAQAKLAAGRWVGRREISFPDFVTWAVTNWTAIMRKQFKWMTKNPPPAVPAWGFLIYHIDQFAECRAKHKLEDWLSDADRTEIDKLMSRGATWEEAMAKHAQAKAAGALRGEMERTALEASAIQRAADLTMDRARKLVDYAGNAPIHPRSRAALRMKREAEAAREPVVIVGEPATGDLKGFTPSELLPERNPFDGD